MKELAAFAESLFNKWWFRHLVFWIVMVNYFAWGYGLSNPQNTYLKSLALIGSGVVIVYPVLYFLIPDFLVKRKILLFFLGYLILVTSAAVIRAYLSQITGMQLTHRGFDSMIGNNFLPYTHLCCIAASVKLLRHAYFQQANAEAAEQDKALVELELLKTQIHPHFLFNTLNSLYSHSRQNSDNAPEIILKLSDLLRFMIYESQSDFIPLKQEIQLLKNYVELEKFRYGDDIDISLNFSGDIEGKMIRPLLLLPLLENCFKHGTGKDVEQKWISLDLNVDGDEMNFNLTNSRSSEYDEEYRNNPKGVSLTNIKRRIELYYPGEHTFMVKEDGEIFLVKLELRLRKQTVEIADQPITQNTTYGLQMPAGR